MPFPLPVLCRLHSCDFVHGALGASTEIYSLIALCRLHRARSANCAVSPRQKWFRVLLGVDCTVMKDTISLKTSLWRAKCMGQNRSVGSLLDKCFFQKGSLFISQNFPFPWDNVRLNPPRALVPCVANLPTHSNSNVGIQFRLVLLFRWFWPGRWISWAHVCAQHSH